MALFFDQAWFDARLRTLGLTQADVGAALSLSAEAVSEMWKDQRELTAKDVLLLARLLNLPAATVANRAGVSTPVPEDGVAHAGPLEDRVARLEALVDVLQARLSRLERSDGG